jgi:hypothetical protein
VLSNSFLNSLISDANISTNGCIPDNCPTNKAKALIELEQDFRKNLNDEKDSDHSSDSKKSSNFKIKQTKPFVDYRLPTPLQYN